MPPVSQEVVSDRQFTQATKLISDGRYHQALPLCELILTAHPHHAETLNNTAIAYFKLGHVETAISYFDRALQVDPTHANSFFNLISLHLKRGDAIQAALTFHTYHQQIPDCPQKENLARRLWPPPLTDALIKEDGTLNHLPIRQAHTRWGKTERPATLSFLQTTLEMAAHATNILASGGELTTVLLAHMAAQKNLNVWILEHHPTWHAYLCAILERLGLEEAAHVCHTPLQDYGEFVGYELPEVLPESFDLVIGERLSDSADGKDPYGLFPLLRDRLEAACTALLGDVSPTADAEVLARWKAEGGFAVEVTHDDDPPFAALSRSTAPSAAPPLPTAQRRARPLSTDGLLERLRQHPTQERTFYRLIRRLLEAGYDQQAADIFETFEANIRESSSKQSLRTTLFDRTIDLDADRPGPICIGGCGSSGTNLLRRILDAHSQIACGKEMSVFDRPHLYRMSLAELRDLYLSGSLSALDKDMPVLLTGKGDRSYCGLEPGNHGDYYHTPAEVLNLFDRAESVADFLDAYFLSFAQKRGKRLWAEKTPNNIFCANDFLEMYPEGRFIQMVRDGRDVCLSLIKRRSYNLSEAMKRWAMSIEAGLRVADHERVYTLRYEDLVLQPDATLKRLFEWLRLPYEETVLQFNRKNEKNAHGYAEASIHTQSAYRWKQAWPKMPPVERQRLDLCLARHLTATGYPLSSSVADSTARAA